MKRRDRAGRRLFAVFASKDVGVGDAEFDLIIVGAGGFGHEVLQYARDAAEADRLRGRLKGFLDDLQAAAGATVRGERVLGPTDGPAPAAADRFIIGVGEPRDRERLAARIAARGGAFATVVHPTAYIAPTAVIGDGSVICPFAFVGPYARIGSHAVVNAHASVGHDCELGDLVTLSPHAAVNGGAVVGCGVFLGTGSIVTPRCRVGDRAVVAAGAVVYQHVADGQLAHGNPARSRTMPAEPEED